MPQDLSFVWGVRYYRAPTPEPQCWGEDFARIKELGFNTVKFIVQWRWAHRAADRFYYEDLDPLMDLAAKHELKVTLGLAMDVAPLWLYYKYPDARQVTVSGTAIQQHATAARPIGGTPGPCYNHPGALGHRQDFVGQVVEHFKSHPALGTWDVWSEAKRQATSFYAHGGGLVCYCHHCRERFIGWLKTRYESRDKLNGVWGRCYEEWHEIELPRSGEAIADFIDWREFQFDTIANEGNWRLEMVRQRDSAHAPAGETDLQTAEVQINGGSTASHQRIVGKEELLRELLPRLGEGMRGVCFEQYRPEVLGTQSPAGGLVHLDGSDRPITKAVHAFHIAITPHLPSLRACRPRQAEIGLWRSRKNEIFHQAVHGHARGLVEGIQAYTDALYWQSYPVRTVSTAMLEAGQLEGLKLLILPSCYCLTEAEAKSLDAWVKGGGVLLAEAHLGGYNATTGRHSRTLPGCGLSEAWGIRELDTEGVEEPFPLRFADGTMAWGVERFAILGGEGVVVEATRDGVPCIISKPLGQGHIHYCGTNLGRAAQKDDAGLRHLLARAIARAGAMPTLGVQADEPGAVHVDGLEDAEGVRWVIIHNRSSAEQAVRLTGLKGSWRGLFTDAQWSADGERPLRLSPGYIDLFVRA